MAFRFTQVKRFRAEVTVPMIKEDGEYDKSTFWAIFEHANVEELAALRLLPAEEVVQKKLVGWEMVDAETKQDVPFTPETLKAAMSIAPTTQRMNAAFWDSVYGARAKN